MYKYEILTENKNRDKIIAEASKFFDGFSITEMIGFWKGIQEKSLNITVIGLSDERVKIQHLADAIQFFNNQESVMILISEVHEQ